MKNRKKPLFGIGLAVAALLAAGAMARGVESKNAPDFARERAALIGRIPPAPAGTVSIDAEAMRPLVQDDQTFKIERNKPVQGMTTAWVGDQRLKLRDPDNDGGYWKLTGIKPGKYFLGVWYGSGKAGAEATLSFRGSMGVFLNGRVVQLNTTSDPIQVAPGVYFAEAQTKEAIALTEGDEIDVLSARTIPIRVARLTLYPNEPLRGRNWVHENYGANMFVRDSALRMNLDCAFLGAPGKEIKGSHELSDAAGLVAGDSPAVDIDYPLAEEITLDVHGRQVQGANLPEDLRKTPDGVRAVAQCRIANPLHIPVTVEYSTD